MCARLKLIKDGPGNQFGFFCFFGGSFLRILGVKCHFLCHLDLELNCAGTKSMDMSRFIHKGSHQPTVESDLKTICLGYGNSNEINPTIFLVSLIMSHTYTSLLAWSSPLKYHPKVHRTLRSLKNTHFNAILCHVQ